MLTLRMPPDLESRLRERAAKTGIEPDAFVFRAVEQALTTVTPSEHSGAARSESELLGRAGVGLSDSVWARYRQLRAKHESDALSPGERDELVSITNQIEIANASRMRALIELADLRKVPLEELMDQLGLGNGAEVAGGSNGG
jgi:hypothetical protein